MVTIYCDLIGTLQPPAWFLDNAPLSAEPPGLTIEDTGLTLSNVKVSQSGWYTCSAANQWGREEHDFLVIVGGKRERESKRERKRGREKQKEREN